MYMYNDCLAMYVHVIYIILVIITGIDLLDVIRPFCDVVINEETTGPVTGQAIFSLDKFLASGLFGKYMYM